MDVMNEMVSRRDFLRIGAAAAGASLLGAGRVLLRADEPDGGFCLGVQSFSFRNFKFPETLKMADELGVHYIEFYPGHLPISTRGEKLSEVKRQLTAAGLKPNGYGVIGFGKNEEQNRRIFEFAQEFGLRAISADPSPDSFASLDKLVAEFDIRIAIHNHGPGSRYTTVDTVLNAIRDHDHRIGACIDVGHYVHSGTDPVDAVRRLGKRVYGVHLKDTDAAGHLVPVGEGTLDLVGFLRLLKANGFDGYMSLEYESDPKDPLPNMKKCMTAIRAAIAKV